jgi:hypothetical protein
MITSLLFELDRELRSPVRIASSTTNVKSKSIEEKQVKAPPQKQVQVERSVQPETEIAPPPPPPPPPPVAKKKVVTPPPVAEQQEDSEYLSIDDDSDYDIYEMLLDSEFDSYEVENEPTPEPVTETQSQHAENESNVAHEQPPTEEAQESANQVTGGLLEERRLLGLVRKLFLKGQPVEIKHYIYPPIRIYPEQELFAYEAVQEIAPNIFTTQVSGFSSQELDAGKQTPPDNWNIKPLWLLFYLASLYGSEGRLKAGDNLQDKLTLTAKPNFELVPSDPEYKAVANYLATRELQDVQTVADVTGVEIGTVIDFCNACEEINILSRISANSTEIRVSSSEISQEQNLESSMPDNNGVNNKGLVKRFISKLKHTE